MPYIKKIFPFFVVVTLIFLASCSDDGPGYVTNLHFDNKTDAQIAFEKSSVACQDPTECPGYMGGLVSYHEVTEYSFLYGNQTKYNVGFCTHQLIAADKVLTNRHCIPESIAQKGAACSENVMVKFPNTSEYPAESVGCKSIMDIGETYADSPGRPSYVKMIRPDWAVIELERPVKRAIPKVSLDGLEHNEAFSAYPVYYSPQTHYRKNGTSVRYATGEIKKINCKSAMDSFYSIYYNHPQSPIVVSYCDHAFIGGNSGSGIFKDGSLTGVLSFALANESTTFHIANTSGTVTNKLAGGTNIACLPYFNDSPSPLCEYDTSEPLNNLGQFSTWTHAVKPTDEQKEEVEKIIEGDENLRWGANALDFFARDPRGNKFIGNLPEDYLMLGQYIEKVALKNMYPYAPTCVQPHLKEEGKFRIKFPFFEKDMTAVKLGEFTDLTIPVEIKHLSYEMEYRPESDSFQGRMRRLSKGMLVSYRMKTTRLLDSVRGCILRPPSQRISTKCQRMSGERRAFKSYKASTGIEDSLFQNEDLLSEYPGMETIELPVCE